MINHARTLLLNVDGTAGGFGGHPGDEYIPPDYRRVELGSLQSVYQALFGSNPDRVALNYRARRLLALLHSTPLVEYALAWDSRITYDVSPLDAFFDELFRLEVTGIDTADRLYLVGDPQFDDRQGRSYVEWLVEISTSTTVRIRRRTPPVSENTYTFTTAGGVSSLVPLQGEDLQIRFEPSLGNQWLVSGYVRPAEDLGQLESSLRSLGEPLLVKIFRIATPKGKEEPYQTYRNCWERHDDFAYRLSGFLMAYLDRVEELRREG